MQFFNFINRQQLVGLIKVRRFETKIGERIHTIQNPLQWQEEIVASEAPFVLLGIPEDMGIEANYGKKGAANTWPIFLQEFVHIQSNDFFIGSEILMLGAFDFTALDETIHQYSHGSEERIEALRHAVNTIDEAVEDIVKKIVAAGKIPIVIGGGHNNAYPLIKGSAKGLVKKQAIANAHINVINVDAHTDYRPMEGRHSGNAFRYAEHDGYLAKYFVLGFHENFISQSVWSDFVNNTLFDAISYEDIFLREKCSFLDAVVTAMVFTEDAPVGIEIDADSIKNLTASAATPSGFSVNDIRQFIHLAASKTQVAYLHLCEGIATTENRVAKCYGYWVADFVKAYLHKEA
jgi:formiminoglutamase